MLWIFMLYIYSLGLNISQAAGKDNSTQMYYVKLTIDKNAIGNLTALLKPFVSGSSLYVEDLQKTTTCQNKSSNTECHCESGHKWSETVCQSEPECCDKNTCTFHEGSSHMCVSNDTVIMNGSVSLKDDYLGCLAKKDSEQFQNCSKKLLTEMKEEYSTLKGFDSITVDNYRQGSILADFEVTVANKVKPKELIKVLEKLGEKLSSSLKLDTTGVVRLEMPPNPVCYDNTYNLRCTVQEQLTSDPVWKLRSATNEYEIHNGTESVVTFSSKETNVKIERIAEPWEGEYTCLYSQTSESFPITINHKASAVMDLILLPNIDITTIPSFPQCKEGSQDVIVKVQCQTKQRNENYTVSWTSQNSKRSIVPLDPSSANGILVHAAQTSVSCNSTTTPSVTCTYKNSCNQERKETITINVIKEGDQFCEAEDDWEVTKAGFPAKLKCKKGVGQRERKCENGSTEATWGPEVEYCVNPEVKNLLNKAQEVSTGRGSPDENAARVFSVLENVTKNTETINTFANLNTSVDILSVMSKEDKLHPNESASNDFLESSSNMLDESLNKSWIHKADSGSSSLASKYLSSVEKLVERSNITGVPNKKNLEVAVSKCSKGSNCSNTVFNVSITLESENVSEVKTVGFQQLHKYLPYNEEEFETNSIVVSATTGQENKDSLKVTINFGLLKKRPRNTEIKCVYWNNDSQTWSGEGCEAVDQTGKCVCTHLSSFAILMSKQPLNVSGLEELTFVGLSVSVISLAITLVIEMTVWSAVVKTNTLYIRHLAHINISLCLLIADVCFLASSESKRIPQVWCVTSAVLMHFCYLAMFFWMLCLSCTLLHQAVFLFHNVSKKNYLQFSVAVGYVCPFLIVVITILANKIGAEGIYYSRETCWLVYRGLLKGSIFTFVIPVGIIVFINVFFMLVVIMKLLDHPKNIESSHDKEKKAAKTVIRSVIFLTPVFGVTWIFGFFVILLDLTEGIVAYAANYAFVLLNAFQGLFILIVTCLADKMTRDALMKRIRKRAPASSTNSVTKLDSVSKK